MTSIDAAIIGGGVSGLTAANALRARGHHVLVLERQIRAGGNAISQRAGGFLMEHGPSAVNLGMQDIDALASDLGLDASRVDLGPGVRKRYLTRRGCLHDITLHPLGFFTSGYLSPRGRLRMAAEVLQPRGDPVAQETVAEFGRRRFGAEFADRVLDPLVGGMFAGDAGQASVAHVFPALVTMERTHGSVIRAIARARLKGGAMPARRLCSWRDGIGELPRALAMRLGTAVRTGIAVRRITRTANGFCIETGRQGVLHAAAVILATQPHVAAQMLEPIAPDAAEAAAGIAAPPLAVVFLGYRREQVDHPLAGLGYLTPSSEGRAVSGGLFCSTMFAGRAPRGHVAISLYIGGARAPDLARLPPEALVDIARNELSDLVGARGTPVVTRVRQWPRGLPQYQCGHDRLTGLLGAVGEDGAGLFITGNYLRGVSVGACVAGAIETAGKADRFLVRHERGLARCSV